jgi:hypothetical protein
MSEKWKADQVSDTFNAFFSQFGELNQNSRVVLEVILEELLYGKSEALFISHQKRSNWDEVGFGVPGSSLDPPNATGGYKNT